MIIADEKIKTLNLEIERLSKSAMYSNIDSMRWTQLTIVKAWIDKNQDI